MNTYKYVMVTDIEKIPCKKYKINNPQNKKHLFYECVVSEFGPQHTEGSQNVSFKLQVSFFVWFHFAFLDNLI